MKKITTLILILVMSLFFVTISYAAVNETDWTLDSDGYYYYNLSFTIRADNHNESYGLPGIEYAVHDNEVIWHPYDTSAYHNGQPIEYSINHGSWQYIYDDIDNPTMKLYSLYAIVYAIDNGNGTYTNNFYVHRISDATRYTFTGHVGDTMDIRMRYKNSSLIEDPSDGLDSDLMGIWHHVLGDRAYVYIRYVFDGYYGSTPVQYTMETNPNDHYTTPNASILMNYNDHVFGIKNPDPSVYDTLTIVERKNGSETTIFSGAKDELQIITSTYGGFHIGLSYTDTNLASDYSDYLTSTDETTSIKIYWEQSEDQGTVDSSAWPMTTGNPYSNTTGDWGFVDFDVNSDTHVVDLSMTYQSTVYHDQMTVEDISFLQNINTAYYYTDEGDQFIYIRYDSGDVLRSSYSDIEGNQWRGFAVWNLTTNQVSVINKVLVKTYLVVDENHDAYAYFYTPNVIMDELLSVTISFRYRWLDYFGGYSEWEAPELITLEAGAQSVSVTTWETKLLTTTAAASAISAGLIAGLTTVPLTWPLLAAAGLTAAVYYAFNQNITGYRHVAIDQIDNNPTLSTTFIDQMESALDVDIDQTANSPKKLYLGQYQQSLKQRVDFDTDSFNYVEMVWRTDGHVYVIDSDQIVTDPPQTDYSGDENDPGVDAWGWIVSQIALAYASAPQVFWIVGGVVLLITLPTIAMFFKGVKKGFKTLFTPLGIMIVLLIGLAVWILTG